MSGYTVSHVRIEYADTVNVIKKMPAGPSAAVELTTEGVDLASILDAMAVRLTRIESQLELLLAAAQDDLK